MIDITIQAPDIYNEVNKKIEESTDLIVIALCGDTYPIKDQLKKLGFRWDGDQWEYNANRKWFKANGYQFVRSLAKEFGAHPTGRDILGEQAKIAVKTMDK